MKRNETPRLFWWLSGALLAVSLFAAAGIIWLRAQPGNAAGTAALDGPTATPTAMPPEVAQADATVPAGTAALLIDASATPAPSVTATAIPSPTPTLVITEYIIQPNDTLVAIAAEFGISVEAIVALNGLEDADQIDAGATLRLPPPGATIIAPSSTPTHTPLPPEEAEPTPLSTGGAGGGVDTPSPLAPGARTLGLSAGGRPIEHYVFGDGPADVVFVGAIHGGYEWNTANLAYEMIDYFDRNPGDVPEAVTLHIIPVANPDGLSRVSPGWTTGPIPPPTGVLSDTVPGRFNERDVDLNRNFDCDWAATGTWRNQEVSGGTAPFSESETAALRDFFLSEAVRAVVFWHSAAGVVLAGWCSPATVHEPSVALAEVYAAASGYSMRPSLVYEITGDASDWLTTEGIPSFAVELTNHTAMEWDRNLAGTLAILDHYAALCAGDACQPPSDR